MAAKNLMQDIFQAIHKQEIKLHGVNKFERSDSLAADMYKPLPAFKRNFNNFVSGEYYERVTEQDDWDQYKFLISGLGYIDNHPDVIAGRKLVNPNDPTCFIDYAKIRVANSHPEIILKGGGAIRTYVSIFKNEIKQLDRTGAVSPASVNGLLEKVSDIDVNFINHGLNEDETIIQMYMILFMIRQNHGSAIAAAHQHYVNSIPEKWYQIGTPILECTRANPAAPLVLKVDAKGNNVPSEPIHWAYETYKKNASAAQNFTHLRVTYVDSVGDENKTNFAKINNKDLYISEDVDSIGINELVSPSLQPPKSRHGTYSDMYITISDPVYVCPFTRFILVRLCCPIFMRVDCYLGDPSANPISHTFYIYSKIPLYDLSRNSTGRLPTIAKSLGSDIEIDNHYLNYVDFVVPNRPAAGPGLMQQTVASYSVEYLILDFMNFLFSEQLFPWSDKKYAKRINRMVKCIFMKDLSELSLSTNKNMYGVINTVFTNITKIKAGFNKNLKLLFENMLFYLIESLKFARLNSYNSFIFQCLATYLLYIIMSDDIVDAKGNVNFQNGAFLVGNTLPVNNIDSCFKDRFKKIFGSDFDKKRCDPNASANAAKAKAKKPPLIMEGLFINSDSNTPMFNETAINNSFNAFIDDAKKIYTLVDSVIAPINSQDFLNQTTWSPAYKSVDPRLGFNKSQLNEENPGAATLYDNIKYDRDRQYSILKEFCTDQLHKFTQAEFETLINWSSEFKSFDGTQTGCYDNRLVISRDNAYNIYMQKYNGLKLNSQGTGLQTKGFFRGIYYDVHSNLDNGKDSLLQILLREINGNLLANGNPLLARVKQIIKARTNELTKVNSDFELSPNSPHSMFFEIGQGPRGKKAILDRSPDDMFSIDVVTKYSQCSGIYKDSIKIRIMYYLDYMVSGNNYRIDIKLVEYDINYRYINNALSKPSKLQFIKTDSMRYHNNNIQPDRSVYLCGLRELENHYSMAFFNPKTKFWVRGKVDTIFGIIIDIYIIKAINIKVDVNDIKQDLNMLTDFLVKNDINLLAVENGSVDPMLRLTQYMLDTYQTSIYYRVKRSSLDSLINTFLDFSLIISLNYNLVPNNLLQFNVSSELVRDSINCFQHIISNYSFAEGVGSGNFIESFNIVNGFISFQNNCVNVLAEKRKELGI